MRILHNCCYTSSKIVSDQGRNMDKFVAVVVEKAAALAAEALS